MDTVQGVPINDWSALAQILKNSGLSSADISRLFSPELGELTGTFQQSAEQDAADEQISWLENAPTLLRTLSLPDTDIRKIIAAEVQRGTNPWDIRRMVEEYAAKQAELNPGVYNQDGETKDLLSFVDTINREFNNKQVADLKKSRSSSEDKSGLPSSEARFTAGELAPEFMDMLSKRVTTASERANAAKMSPNTVSAAQKFLQEREAKTVKEQGDGQRFMPEPPSGGENFIQSLQRNLANTPMGRGEAGVRGLIPLYKMLEQVPAGAAALFRGVTDPIYDEAISNLKYVTESTLGKELPKLGTTDALGQILYGRPREQIASEQFKASRPVESEAEMTRFGNIAKDVVRRAEDPELQKERARLSRQSRLMDEAKQLLAAYIEQKAVEKGVTPRMSALATRANFLASGGK